MQIVIDIDEEDYKIMKHNIAVNNPLCPLSQEEMVSKVADGTPLPKLQADMFAKIRAEIEKEYLAEGHSSDYWDGIDKCLQIINKYKAESEGEK